MHSEVPSDAGRAHRHAARCGRAVRMFAILLVAEATLAFPWPAAGQAPQPTEPTPQPQLRIEGGAHTGPIRRIATDAANRYAVTASDDKTARVWEVATGRLLRVLRPPIGANNAGKIFATAISPDGQFVAVGGWPPANEPTTTFYVFDRGSGRMLRAIGNLPGVVSQLVYSRDGRYLAATFAGGSGALRVYSTANFALTAEDHYGGDSYGVDFDASDRLATTSYDGQVRLYALDQRGALRVVARTGQVGGRMPHALRFSPDGSRIAVGVYDAAAIAVLSGQALQPLYFPSTTYAANVTVEWSANGRNLLAGVAVQPGWGVRVWADAGAGAARDVALNTDSIMTLCALANGDVLYGASDGALGLIASTGAVRQFAGAPIALFDRRGQGLLVSDDATVVQFHFDAREPRRSAFTLSGRRLDTVAGPELRPPLQYADGLAISDWSFSFSPKLNGAPLQLEQTDTSISLAILPDRQSFVLGTGFGMRQFDRRGVPLRIFSTPSIATAVNTSADGRFLVAAFGDGTIRWYRLSDGEEMLALFAHRDGRRWVLWTPSGYFDASPGAESLVGWHVNNGRAAAADFFPVGQFRTQYYRPDVVARILQTGDVQLALAQANAAAGRRESTAAVSNLLPPVVDIVSPADGANTSATQVELRYIVRSPSGEPATGLRMLVDGRPVGERVALPRDAGPAPAERRVSITVPERDAEITLIAENRFAASVPATVRVRWRGNAGAVAAPAAGEFVIKPKLYVLAVGVGAYANKEYNLEFPAKDARDFSAAMQAQGGLLYREVTVRALTDAQATRAAVVEGLDWIRKETTAKDVAMVFFAGHGVNDLDGSYYFLPHDTDVGKLLVTGVPFTMIRTAVQSIQGKAVFFIDSCHSGNALGGMKRRGLSDDINGVINELTSAENGAVVFAASSGNQSSLESSGWQNGAFTKALVEGVNGGADYRGTGRITINMLDLYMSERVKTLTGGRQTPTTAKPQTVADFPIAVRR